MTQKKELSFDAVYYQFRKWSRDGSLQKAFEDSILRITDDLNLSEINLDGSHSLAKKGGEREGVTEEQRCHAK